MTIAELKAARHLNTDLAQIARLIPDHRKGILLCDEKHIHVYTTAGTFSVEWIDWEYGGGTNHKATAEAVEKRLASATQKCLCIECGAEFEQDLHPATGRPFHATCPACRLKADKAFKKGATRDAAGIYHGIKK